MIKSRSTIMPELMNFSAIPVALRPNHTTSTAGMVKIRLPTGAETPSSSARISPLPLVYEIMHPMELAHTEMKTRTAPAFPT